MILAVSAAAASKVSKLIEALSSAAKARLPHIASTHGAKQRKAQHQQNFHQSRSFSFSR